MRTGTTHSFLDRLPSWVHSPWVFAILAIALYANTLNNEFALDDGLVLNENSYVMRGMAGIPDILSHDSFHGSVGNSAYLSGGRYRPLPLVSYAVEVSLFGLQPAVHHAMNVLLFALSCVILFRFLGRFVFPDHRWAAWCVTLLFTVHPVHTEVVANIKGRDEILSLIFLLLTLHHALAYLQWGTHTANAAEETRSKRKERERSGKKIGGERSWLWATLCFALALLSKENGLIFVLVLPLTLHFLGGVSIPESFRRSLPVIGLALFYVALRIALLGARNNTVQEIMDNPYLFATAPEKIASILYILLRYIQLMFWPHPLVYDYSFAQIPLHGFNDPIVYVSLALHIGLLGYAIIGFRRNELLSWCILFYFGTLFLVSNLFFNIGAPMGERFLYQASVPFLIGCVEVVRRITAHSAAARFLPATLAALLLVITSLSSYAVVQRNTDWRTGDDLFLHDVETSPLSARTRTFAGIALIHRSDEAKAPKDKRAHALAAVDQFLIADSIHRNYLPTLLNMGLAYYRLDSLATAEAWWDRARGVDANDPKLKQLEEFLFDLYYKGGLAAGVGKDFPEAIRKLEKAVKYAPRNADAWYNLGGVCYTVQDTACARRAWEKALALAPDHAQARQGMTALRAAAR